MNLKPLDDRIVVRPNEAEQTTVSGLVIPDSGEIIPLDVKVGDTVVYSKYGGTEIAVDGEDVLILSSRDVLAIIGSK
jgi:chaperonin GroES